MLNLNGALLTNRRAVEAAHRKRVAQTVQHALNLMMEMHADGEGWLTIPFQFLKNEGLQTDPDRAYFNYALQARDDVACRPAKNSVDSTAIAHTVEFMYRYTDCKSLHDLCFRRVQGDLRDRLIGALIDADQLPAPAVAVFALLDRLKAEEADAGFVELSPYALAAKSAVPIDDLVDAVDALEQLGLLCHIPELTLNGVVVKNLFKITADAEECAAWHAAAPEDIPLHRRIKPTRAKRNQAPVDVDDTACDDTASDAHDDGLADALDDACARFVDTASAAVAAAEQLPDDQRRARLAAVQLLSTGKLAHALLCINALVSTELDA